MPKGRGVGSRARAKSRADLDKWVSKGKRPRDWRQPRTLFRQRAEGIGIYSKEDIATLRAFLTAQRGSNKPSPFIPLKKKR